MSTRYLLAITTAVLLSGCANTEQLDQMTSKIDRLSNKVDQLSSEIDEMKSQQDKNSRMIKQAKESSEKALSLAENANQRVNNMIDTYKK